jgi:hypothetical protein
MTASDMLRSLPMMAAALTTEQLVAVVREVVRAEATGGSADDLLTTSEVAKGFRVRPVTVGIATATGVLPAIRRPGAAGRTPKTLIRRSDAEAWAAAGCKVTL